MEECKHVWVSNSGAGGEPVFRTHPQLAGMIPCMHVKCELCNDRTWFSQATWLALKKQQGSNAEITGG